MRDFSYATQYRRDVRLMKKQGKDIERLTFVMDLLIEGKPLPAEFKDHALSGNMSGSRELHIHGDWLLIYHFIN